ncbi:thiamine-phosphate kinase [Flammeovirgaceae bacterium SG7u.111]|nr:thiamine-phosphate kinase [Flammeovirgaceae bacterium SG7u.132]WPO33504.1 thiamine-phosphate kinase [Flammeovirgaceae bacterium SG7u.111]
MAEANNGRTEIQNLGEFGLIDKLASKVEIRQKSTLKGIGDDAAVIAKDEKEVTLVSTDMLVEGVHFDLSYVPLKHLGFKAVSVNVSDIAAMNGVPKQITVSIALTNRFSVEAVEEIYEGIYAACEAFHVDLVGGDTTSSRSGLVISVTAMGTCPKEKVAYRSGAKKGDLVCVTGDLGGAYLGLQILEREKQVYLANPDAQPQLEKYDYIVGRQLKPEARMDVIHTLREQQLVPTSMIDISDGLASELMHLCKNSDVGVVVYENKIPFAEKTLEVASEEFKIPAVTCALNGGEDYELLFTVDQKDFDKVKNHPDITLIGYIQEKENGKKLVTQSEQVMDIKAQGWEHF